MTDAVIISTARTPIGTAFKGSLIDVDAFTLAKLALTEIVRRTPIDPDRYDDVVLGETLFGGGDIARYAAVDAGIPNVAGIAHQRHCASGLSAVITAAASIMAGMDRAVIAGGTNSLSCGPRDTKRIPGTDDWTNWMSPSHPETPEAPAFDMSITVGWNTAVEADVTREQMDAWALRSHQRAVAAIASGAFDDEIFGVEVTERDGTTRMFSVDEHPREDTSMERLAALKVLHPEIEGFSITAGNSSGLNDGAAALVLTDAELAREVGADVLAKVKAFASVGVAPERTGMAPSLVIPKLLGRAGLDVADVNLWEINEAFASVCCATTKILGIDEDKVNVLGSGCSLGHPIAMTGARMVISLIHELRRRGGGTGVAALCAGGGMATGLVVEVP